MFNAKNQGYEGQYPGRAYVPMDPRYLFPYRHRPDGSYLVKDPSKEYAAQPTSSGLEDLMLGRDEILDSKVQMLVSEIDQRHRLQTENLYRINLDQCSFRNLILDTGEHIWDKKRAEFERKIIELEEEKRREQVSYFRDILFLKKELRDTLLEKQEEAQKASLLTNL